MRTLDSPPQTSCRSRPTSPRWRVSGRVSGWCLCNDNVVPAGPGCPSYLSWPTWSLLASSSLTLPMVLPVESPGRNWVVSLPILRTETTDHSLGLSAGSPRGRDEKCRASRDSHLIISQCQQLSLHNEEKSSLLVVSGHLIKTSWKLSNQTG